MKNLGERHTHTHTRGEDMKLNNRKAGTVDRGRAGWWRDYNEATTDLTYFFILISYQII